MKLTKGSRLVMIGDSITDCGRDRECLEGSFEALGYGYVSLVHAFLTGLAPALDIKIINQGISGNTIVDLESRWEESVIQKRPDYLSIMIGINDVWRHFDGIVPPADFVSADQYRTTYKSLIERTIPNIKDIFILGPFMVEENKQNKMRIMCDEYASIARDIAAQFNLTYIDVQSRMDEYLTYQSSYRITADRVHPHLNGHMIIAKAFLDAVDFNWT